MIPRVTPRKQIATSQQGQVKEMIEDGIIFLLPNSIHFLTRPLWHSGRLKMPSFLLHLTTYFHFFFFLAFLTSSFPSCTSGPNMLLSRLGKLAIPISTPQTTRAGEGDDGGWDPEAFSKTHLLVAEFVTFLDQIPVEFGETKDAFFPFLNNKGRGRR